MRDSEFLKKDLAPLCWIISRLRFTAKVDVAVEVSGTTRGAIPPFRYMFIAANVVIRCLDVFITANAEPGWRLGGGQGATADL